MQKAVLGIARDLAKEYGLSDKAESRGDAAAFIFEQVARVPWFLRTGIFVATFAFAVHRILHELRFILRSSAQSFRPLTSKWRSSRLRICRDLIKFYSSLFLLWQFSNADSERIEEPS